MRGRDTWPGDVQCRTWRLCRWLLTNRQVQNIPASKRLCRWGRDGTQPTSSPWTQPRGLSWGWSVPVPGSSLGREPASEETPVSSLSDAHFPLSCSVFCPPSSHVGLLPTHSLSVSLRRCLECPATSDLKLWQSSDTAGGDHPPRTSLSSRAGMFSKSVTLRWAQQSLQLSTVSLEMDGLGSDCSLPPMWTDWSHDLEKPHPCPMSQFHHLEKGMWALPCVM